MTAEEKRMEHQRELAARINEEARERLGGMKKTSTEKVYAFYICSHFNYSNTCCFITISVPYLL